MITYRERAIQLLNWATNGSNGVTASNTRYQSVTESRDPGPGYSSCVDLPFWLMRELAPTKPWAQPNARGNALANFWKAPFRGPKPYEWPKPGDTWVIWEGSKSARLKTHAKIIESLRPVDNLLTSWDYGQAYISPDKWFPESIEGIKKHVNLTGGDPQWIWPDGRKLWLVLTLDDALGFSAETIFPGSIIDPSKTPKPSFSAPLFAGMALGLGLLWSLKKR